MAVDGLGYALQADEGEALWFLQSGRQRHARQLHVT